MNNGYGQIFLLLLAIFLILLGASGKTKQIMDVLKGSTPTSGSQPQYTVPNLTKPNNSADQAGSGMGGVLG